MTEILNITQHKTQRGQAAIETAIVILLFLGVYFSLIQIIHIFFVRIIAFDAAQALVRASIVNKNANIAAIWVLQTQKIGSVIFPTEIKSIKQQNYVHHGKITYLQKVNNFTEFFSLSRIKYLPSSAICWMVAPPKPEFFNRSYPNSQVDK